MALWPFKTGLDILKYLVFWECFHFYSQLSISLFSNLFTLQQMIFLNKVLGVVGITLNKVVLVKPQIPKTYFWRVFSYSFYICETLSWQKNRDHLHFLDWEYHLICADSEKKNQYNYWHFNDLGWIELL